MEVVREDGPPWQKSYQSVVLEDDPRGWHPEEKQTRKRQPEGGKVIRPSLHQASQGRYHLHRV